MSQPKPVIILDPERRQAAMKSSRTRYLKNEIFRIVCVITASMSVLILAVLLALIAWAGFDRLNLDFLMGVPHPDPDLAGLWPALMGTVWICVVCGLVALPLGVATSVFLEEFRPRHWLVRRAHGFIQVNIANLAGVPSVVYGILGLTVFVSMFGLAGTSSNPTLEVGVKYYHQWYNMDTGEALFLPVEGPEAEAPELADAMEVQIEPGGEWVEANVIPWGEPLPEDEDLAARTMIEGEFPSIVSVPQWYHFRVPFGRGVLAGGLTLMLVILPVLIIASQEALRAVPDSLREGALGMGATRWQVVRRVTLPSAVPGIMTGSIIAMSRAIGEAAPLLMIAGIVFIASGPGNLMDDFTAMPPQ
ncbi:MAG: PstA family ABC transporter permease, partial [Phycisphaeraceae bacterium]